MSLHHTYRPRTLDQVFGNKATVLALQRALRDEATQPRTLLFSGPSGCGKTTLARIIALHIGCNPNHDIIELNAAETRGIETAREISNKSNYYPIGGKARCWIIDEVHQATKDFQNAMLKTTEDTPAHNYFIFCTTDPGKLIKTIINRFHRFEVEKLAPKESGELLDYVCKAEKIKLSAPAKDLLIKGADGCPRQLLVMLDSAKGLSDQDVAQIVKNYNAEEHSETIELCRALLKGEKWPKIAGLLKQLEVEPETVRRAVLGYMNTCLLSGKPEAALIIDCFAKNFYDTGKAGLTLACYESCK